MLGSASLYCTFTALLCKSLSINGAGEGNRTLVSGLGSRSISRNLFCGLRGGSTPAAGTVLLLIEDLDPQIPFAGLLGMMDCFRGEGRGVLNQLSEPPGINLRCKIVYPEDVVFRHQQTLKRRSNAGVFVVTFCGNLRLNFCKSLI